MECLSKAKMECGLIKDKLTSISTPFVKNGPRFGLQQMTTHSLSSPLNHFECPARPVAIAQSQAPRNFFSRTKFPLFSFR